MKSWDLPGPEQSMAMTAFGRPDLWSSMLVTPGYDCKNAPCKHDPPGKHGICSETWFYTISDAADPAEANWVVVLQVHSNVFPPTVGKVSSSRLAVMAKHMPRAAGAECTFLGGRDCANVMAVLLASDELALPINFDDPKQSVETWQWMLSWVDDWQQADRRCRPQPWWAKGAGVEK